jgi:predicted transcriptional regulator
LLRRGGLVVVANYAREVSSPRLTWRKKYRSHFEITALMLESVKDGGGTGFAVMKYTNVNSRQLKNHLTYLTEIGFVETHIKEGRVLYRASPKGLAFLRQYYVLLGMLLNARIGNKPARVLYEAEDELLNGQQRIMARIAARSVI